MKAALRVLILLIIGAVCCSPVALAQAPGSRITALTTDEEVKALAYPFGWEYELLVLGDSARVAYKPYRFTSFRRRSKSWYRTDFDGNGWPDLLVVGRLKTIPFIFCVLDSGNNRFRVVRNFYSPLEERQPNAKVVYKRGQPLLHYTAFARSHGPRGGLVQRRTQLLAYRGGGFVPYERHPTTHHITSISYKSFFNYHGIHEAEVKIDSAGQALLTYRTTAQGDSVATTRQERQQLSTQTRQKLAGLLNYVHFATSTSYDNGLHGGHRPIIDLHITYEDGTKDIHDTRRRGNLGLTQVYNCLERLIAPLRPR